MHLAFEDKVTLVTGAGSGLGLATAKAFADAGASVVLADNHEKVVRAEAEDLVAAGHKALANIGITQDIYIKSVTELQVNAMDTLSEKLGICNDYATPRQKRPN